jgi:hypothetical protein
MRILENNHLPGKENISAELLKYGDNKLWKTIHAPIQVIWAPEKMSENQRTAIRHPKHKNGNKHQFSNYR